MCLAHSKLSAGDCKCCFKLPGQSRQANRKSTQVQGRGNGHTCTPSRSFFKESLSPFLSIYMCQGHPWFEEASSLPGGGMSELFRSGPRVGSQPGLHLSTSCAPCDLAKGPVRTGLFSQPFLPHRHPFQALLFS